MHVYISNRTTFNLVTHFHKGWTWRTGDSVFAFQRILTFRYALSSWRECWEIIVSDVLNSNSETERCRHGVALQLSITLQKALIMSSLHVAPSQSCNLETGAHYIITFITHCGGFWDTDSVHCFINNGDVHFHRKEQLMWQKTLNNVNSSHIIFIFFFHPKGSTREIGRFRKHRAEKIFGSKKGEKLEEGEKIRWWWDT